MHVFFLFFLLDLKNIKTSVFKVERPQQEMPTPFSFSWVLGKFKNCRQKSHSSLVDFVFVVSEKKKNAQEALSFISNLYLRGNVRCSVSFCNGNIRMYRLASCLCHCAFVISVQSMFTEKNIFYFLRIHFASNDLGEKSFSC